MCSDQWKHWIALDENFATNLFSTVQLKFPYSCNGQNENGFKGTYGNENGQQHFSCESNSYVNEQLKTTQKYVDCRLDIFPVGAKKKRWFQFDLHKRSFL